MRQLMTALLCTVALSTLGVASAAAADLQMKAPAYKAPVMVPVTSWAGLYVGGNVGYGWDPADAIFNPSVMRRHCSDRWEVRSWIPDLTADLWPSTSRARDGSVAVKSDIIGNETSWCMAEGDFSGMKASASAPFFVNGTEGGDIAGFTGNVGLQQKLDYSGTVRGRLGWANDSVLLYGTGGLAADT